MKSYLAASVCMTSTPDVDKNLQQAEEYIELAVNQGAKLVALPENFAFLGEEEEKVAKRHEISTKSEKFLIRMAQRFQVTILGGGFPTPIADDSSKVHNTAVLIAPNGLELCRYHKIHLFDVNLPDGNYYRESKTVMAGSCLPPVCDAGDLGKLGISICYDVRFPEVFRHLSRQGAEVIFVPAAFTAYTGKDHWEILIRARAIENTCYVIAPAQTGNHYGRRFTHGHAMIVDPWGTVLANTGAKEGIALAEINPQRLQQVRQQMPSLQHRVFG
ncbi:MAG: carbon-nitrogen hydrolase family protein [Geminocystis sp.]|nr:carbon-nitrogen hydrolase family protein [Geminocystis sp.]MDW8463065.1 carbon-nitrogen hydrolase family protein [Geminocystis sp.]